MTGRISFLLRLAVDRSCPPSVAMVIPLSQISFNVTVRTDSGSESMPNLKRIPPPRTSKFRDGASPAKHVSDRQNGGLSELASGCQRALACVCCRKEVAVKLPAFLIPASRLSRPCFCCVRICTPSTPRKIIRPKKSQIRTEHLTESRMFP